MPVLQPCSSALAAVLLASLCLISLPSPPSAGVQAVPLQQGSQSQDSQLLDNLGSNAQDSVHLRLRRSLDGLFDDEDEDLFPMSKRRRAPDFVPVMFKCRRLSAKCLNGGLGPKVSRRAGMPVCMCMCPYGYSQAQCRPEWWVNNV